MNFETAFAHYQAHTATAEETALVERDGRWVLVPCPG